MTSLVPFSALLSRATKNAHLKIHKKIWVLINCKNFCGIFPNSMQRFHETKKKFLGVIGTLNKHNLHTKINRESLNKMDYNYNK